MIEMKEDKIFETQDGSHSVLSHKFGVSYHSKYGAITESKHVFIEAGFLPKTIHKKDIQILEIGLGTGLNALLTMIAAQQHDIKVNYVGVEGFPISESQYKALNYPAILGKEQYEEAFSQIHQSDWGKPIEITSNFTLQKEKMLFEEINFPPQFDVVYFDAFAPSAQPELWEDPIIQKVYDALLQEGILVTYCAKGVVKRRLKSIGFEIESLPGPPGKREMTRGRKKPING